jgi:hypothetical protein
MTTSAQRTEPSAERCTPCRRRNGTFAITAVPVPLFGLRDPWSWCGRPVSVGRPL